MGKDLKEIIKTINKKHGKNTIKFAKEEKPKERLPFGIKEIDELVGGGIPAGNYVIIYGSESCGKSTLAYTQIATLQKKKKICCLIDLEHSFEANYAEKLGVNNSKLLIVTPSNAEEAMDIVITLAKEKVVDYICLDSIQALSPTGENVTKKGKEKSMEDDEVALLARKMGKFLRRTAHSIYTAKIGFLFIGQTRTQGIGTFFTKEGLTGGHSVKHWAVMILQFRRGMKAYSPTEKINGKKTIVGFPVNIKIEKAKLSGVKEGNEILVPFYYDKGFKKEDKINETKEEG